MAIHHPTPPLGGGERPRLPSAQVGPVTQAIRGMRADVADIGQIACPHVRTDAVRISGHASCAHVGAITAVAHMRHVADIRHGIRALSRTEVEDLIGGLIDLLDAMDGDTDLEDGHDAEGGTDDNGIADFDAIGEQGFRGYGGCL
jgi:hypothetical protein